MIPWETTKKITKNASSHRPGFTWEGCHFIARWLWESYFPFLGFCFLISQAATINSQGYPYPQGNECAVHIEWETDLFHWTGGGHTGGESCPQHS